MLNVNGEHGKLDMGVERLQPQCETSCETTAQERNHDVIVVGWKSGR